MKILKKLIIFEWLKAFFTSTLILLILITIADLVSGFLRSSVTPMEVIFNYLFNLPMFFSKILPVSCLIATLFSLNKLRNRNELTVIAASGFSSFNFIILISQIALTITFIQFVNTSFIEPRVKYLYLRHSPENASKFGKSETVSIKRNVSSNTGQIWYKSQNYYVLFDLYEKKLKKLSGIKLYFVSHDKKILRLISANSAHYMKDTTWRFNNVIDTHYLDSKSFPKTNFNKKMDLELSETPENFDQIDADITALNIIKLHRFISIINTSGINSNEYEMLYFDKFSSCLLCLIFSLIPITGVFKPNRRQASFGKNVTFAFIFTLLFWLLQSFTRTLGISGFLPPMVASFAIIFLFSCYLIFSFYKNKKLT
ncbi:MAG: LptF/LptG family permease [Bacteriovoracaceae bacterium]|nr:LptF/LptG family permease [Bacteriovoracaceae bacterium]